jgi:hypothetical protein
MEMTCELENVEVLVTYLSSFYSKLPNVQIFSFDVLSFKGRMHWVLIQCSEYLIIPHKQTEDFSFWVHVCEQIYYL